MIAPRSSRAQSLALALTTLALASCTTTQSESGAATPSRTLGSEGRLTFTGNHCFMPGCAVGPLAAGMTSRIGLSTVGQVPFPSGMRAASSRADVAAVKVVGAGSVNGEPDFALEVEALAPGTSELTVVDGAGALVDRIAIEARAVATFSFAQSFPADSETCTGCRETRVVDEVRVAVREASDAIAAQPRDASGAQLEATTGFEFAVEDTKIARLDCVIGLCITVGEDNQRVRGVAKGTTRFVVEGAGTKASLPVVVE